MVVLRLNLFIFLRLIPNMNLKISITKIFENFIIFALTHTID